MICNFAWAYFNTRELESRLVWDQKGRQACRGGMAMGQLHVHTRVTPSSSKEYFSCNPITNSLPLASYGVFSHPLA
jgi:hypothetical protein